MRSFGTRTAFFLQGFPFFWVEPPSPCYDETMVITLTPEQEAWVTAHVERGEFTSIEAAVRQLVDERIAEIALEEDDFTWAKPYVDEGIAALERGDVMTLEEHKARNTARLAALKR